MKIGRKDIIGASSEVKQDNLTVINQGKANNSKDNIISLNGTEDTIQLSKEAQDLQHFENLAKDIPEIRQEKVDELKELIDKGLYNIDHKKVANRMIREILLDTYLKG